MAETCEHGVDRTTNEHDVETDGADSVLVDHLCYATDIVPLSIIWLKLYIPALLLSTIVTFVKRVIDYKLSSWLLRRAIDYGQFVGDQIPAAVF